MVLSSRDRIPVSVEDRLALSAERRRLRFSFQINDVKDRDRLAGPTVLRPVAARRAVSSRPEIPCQPTSLNHFHRVW